MPTGSADAADTHAHHGAHEAPALAVLRAQKDEFFRNGAESPLTEAQRTSFEGLRYFGEDPALRFVLPLAPSGGGVETIQLSNGATRDMPRVGKFSFVVAGVPVTLAAFASEDGSTFVPFRDATSATETYGAGRYVEAEASPDGSWVLDFNRAYNPFCAYDDCWSCPLPPRENWLAVPIRAGEQLPTLT